MQINNPSKEIPGAGANGFPALALVIFAALMAIATIVSGLGGFGAFLGIIGLTLSSVFILIGFYKLSPNEAGVLTLFGDYQGTDRGTGLRW
jgi:purine-cytosine permease-like protein